MSHKSWEHFKVLSHLKKLSLKGSRVQDADIKLICLIPNLEELHLFGCFKVSDKCFDYICGFSLLKKLSVTHNATISIESAMQVQRLRGLVSLNVEDTFVNDKTLLHIGQHLKSLQVLNLSCCSEVTDTGIQSICALSLIKKLDIDVCQQLTDTAFLHLMLLKK